MSKDEKLLKRFLSMPKDYDFEELVKLLACFNYHEVSVGKTAGSRVKFVNPETLEIIKLHKPHPDSSIKVCYLKQIKDKLANDGYIIDSDGGGKNE